MQMLFYSMLLIFNNTIPKQRTLYNLFDSGAIEMSIMAAAQEQGIDSVPA